MNVTTQPACYGYFRLAPDQIQWVEQTLAELSQPQKVGQLFMAYMIDERRTAEEQLELFADRVKDEAVRYSLGGYYQNRFHFPSTTMLLNIIQRNSPVPLLIGADMEAGAGGGLGGVIAAGLTRFPCPMAIGATRSERYAYLAGYWTAQQAQLVGVNYIFAPSCDVNNNPENPIINIRSYSEDAYDAARLSSACIRGIQEGGLPASAKHFPGHGDTNEDTHLKVCRINASRERIFEVELQPFMRAIDEARVDSIMTGHLSVPVLEPVENTPATFSKAILQDLLRAEMHFEGVIISDAMLMGGVATLCDPGEAAVRAVLAGCDIILMPPDLGQAYQGVSQAVERGAISADRLDESVRRILAMKAKYELRERSHTDTGEIPNELLELPDQVSYNISSDAVTLVKNANHILPLEHGDNLGVIFMSDSEDELSDKGHLFLHTVSHLVGHEYHLSIHPGSDADAYAIANKIIQQFETLIIAVDVPVMPEKDRIDLPDEYAAVINSALQQKNRVILLSFSNPYLIQHFKEVDAYLCAYNYVENTALAAVEIMFGDRAPHGRLPVTIPGLYDMGTGLTY